MSFKDALNDLSHKEIKTLIRNYNLHTRIKLGQSKEALIEALIKHVQLSNNNKLQIKKTTISTMPTPAPKPVKEKKKRLTAQEKRDKKAKEEPIEEPIEEPAKDDRNERLKELVNLSLDIRNKSKVDSDVIKKAQQELQELRDAKAKRIQQKEEHKPIENLHKKTSGVIIENDEERHTRIKNEFHNNMEPLNNRIDEIQNEFNVISLKKIGITRKKIGIKKERELGKLIDKRNELIEEYNKTPGRIAELIDDKLRRDRMNKAFADGKRRQEQKWWDEKLLRQRLNDLRKTSIDIRNKSKADSDVINKAQQELQKLRVQKQIKNLNDKKRNTDKLYKDVSKTYNFSVRGKTKYDIDKEEIETLFNKQNLLEEELKRYNEQLHELTKHYPTLSEYYKIVKKLKHSKEIRTSNDLKNYIIKHNNIPLDPETYYNTYVQSFDDI